MTQAHEVDIEELMRRGHPYLAETADAVVEAVTRAARTAGRAPRVFELGCASAILSSRIRAALPHAEIIAAEELPELAALARRRLAGTGVQLYTGRFQDFAAPIDVLFSGGAHHHLASGYLAHARELIAPGGVYVLADELCPEYCHGALAERIAAAERIAYAGGFVLTSAAECAAYEAHGAIPDLAVVMERRRKQALWRWYRFVVDHAMAGGHYEVAVAELGSARDDLVTGSLAEHKMSPAIVERELALAGFLERARRVVGPADDPSLHSFHVYELVRS